jgi:hypothetical protein
MAKSCGGKLGMSGKGYDVKMPTGNGKGKAPAQNSTKVKPKKKK